MMYAIDKETGTRREPVRKNDRAICPICDCELIGKFGKIIVPHWAHQFQSDCDSWSEGETDWHRKWKEVVAPEFREVVIGPHRADIQLPSGLIVELQHSSISTDEIFQRESFYGNMVWLFDGRQISVSPPDDARECHCLWDSNDFGTRKTWTCDRCRDALQLEHSKYGIWIKQWKHRRKTWLTCKRPIYIDLGQAGVLRIVKIENGIAKYGKLGSVNSFRSWLSVAGK